MPARPPSRPPALSAERKSKRARKGRAPLTVDSCHTLEQLKLRILEAIDVHPRNAQLFVRCRACRVCRVDGVGGWVGGRMVELAQEGCSPS